MNVLTKDGTVAILAQNLIRVTARFFSGVLHPHLLGVCCPNLFCSRGDSEVDARRSNSFGVVPFRQAVPDLQCFDRAGVGHSWSGLLVDRWEGRLKFDVSYDLDWFENTIDGDRCVHYFAAPFGAGA